MDSSTPTNRNEIPSCSKDNESPSKDALFDPSIDMLINDFDDERTLEEEEALAAGEANDPSTELSNLEKEGNMPLEDLLALYGYNIKDKGRSSESEDEDQQNLELEQLCEQVEKDRSLTPLRHSKLSLLYEPISDDVEDTRNMTSVSRISDGEDAESSTEDGEFHTPNNGVHSIMVGSDYQAQIPDEIINYDEIPANDEDDKLLWNPQEIYSEVVEEYLRKAHEMFQPPNPKKSEPRDDEEAELRDDELVLSLLKECGYNTEDALRKLEMRGPNKKITNGNDARWLEEECHNSEPGARSFGKDFLQIPQNKIND